MMLAVQPSAIKTIKMAAVSTKFGSKFSDTAFASSLLSTLSAFRKAGVLTDVDLTIRKGYICAHQVVLAAASQVFAAMFQAEMKERSEKKVDLTSFQIADSVAEDLIDYLYTGFVKLTADNVEDLLSASSFLMISSLRDACCSFLEESLAPYNCLGIAKIASKYDCLALIEKSNRMIQENFTAVVQDEEFLHLHPDDVLELLLNDDIEVESETCVFQALIRWVKNDLETRSKFFPSLISSIRLSLLDDSSFLSIEAEWLTEGSELCYAIKSDDLGIAEIDQACPRKCLDTTEVIFSTGGYDGSHCLTSTFAFSFSHMKWAQCSPMLVSRHDHAVVVHGEHLFVVGGFNSHKGPLSSVEGYNPIRDKWIHHTPMNSKRKSLGAVSYKGLLYVCGGLDETYNSLNTVEVFDQAFQKWVYVASMRQPRYSHMVVASDNAIFAIGGWQLSNAEKFSGNQWQDISPMMNPRAGAIAVYKHEKIYVVGGHGDNACSASMEIYDTMYDFWIAGVSCNLARWRAGAALVGDYLYVVGGRESTWQYLNSIESYNIQNEKWQQEMALPFSIMGLRCALISVPKSKLKFF